MGVPVEHVLWEMSYVNCLMYGAALPHWDDADDRWDPGKDANDPRNFRDDGCDEIYVS